MTEEKKDKCIVSYKTNTNRFSRTIEVSDLVWQDFVSLLEVGGDTKGVEVVLKE